MRRRTDSTFAGVGGVVIQGFLTKQGHVVRNWKKRWVVVTGTLLQYFENEPKDGDQLSAKLKGFFDVDGSVVEAVDVPGRPWAFKISNDGTDLLLFAESEQKRQEWIAALGDVNRPLHMAARKGDSTAIKSLLRSGGIEAIDAVDSQDRTVLFYCAQHGFRDLVEQLLDLGADVNLRTQDGKQPLWVASRNGHEDVVVTLLKAGASVNGNGLCDVGTPLLMASQRGHVNCVKRLCSARADVNIPVADRSDYPLTAAAADGRADICSVLLQAGANVNAQTARKQCALHVAAGLRDGAAAVCKLLLDRGADRNVTDNAGLTPLDVAKQSGREEIMAMLMI
eukprot:TRINITY_DN15163_c0_g1_i1.p1 TRINITY_DN15163_c0_g1~~TRINITY_DN15163_c0_g1_i1.p1  ORF type:complete len:338 (-),score=50.67 TRINITY_DN15163_c0_g1_i1:84-1097(-)